MALDPDARSFSLHGAGLFDPDFVLRLRSRLEAFEDSGDNQPSGAREAKAVRLGGFVDKIRMDDCWYEIWRSRHETLAAYFQPFTFVSFPPFIRHLTEAPQLVPWHQDAGYQHLRGARAHSRVITCFLPLEPNPAKSATLEFAEGSFDLMPHEDEGDHGAVLTQAISGERRTYDLNAGDALVFGDFAPHRTVEPSGSVPDRYSIEFRLVAPGEAVPGNDYFCLKEGCFVQPDGSRRQRP